MKEILERNRPEQRHTGGGGDSGVRLRGEEQLPVHGHQDSLRVSGFPEHRVSSVSCEPFA